MITSSTFLAIILFLFQSGPYQNHHRWYSPDLGRYLSGEPLAKSPGYMAAMGGAGMSVSSYSYALNDPMRFIDFTGLSPEERLRLLAEYAVFLTRETQAGRRLDAPGPVTDFMSAYTRAPAPYRPYGVGGPIIAPPRVHACGEQADDLITYLSDQLSLKDYWVVPGAISGWDGISAHQWVYVYSRADNESLILDPFLGTAWSAPFSGTPAFETSDDWLPRYTFPTTGDPIWTKIFNR